MEENVISEGKAIIKDINNKKYDEIKELESTTGDLELMQHLLKVMATELPPEQAYVCMREVNEAVQVIEQTILKKWSSLNDIAIKLEKTQLLDKFQNLGLNETSQLASICQEEKLVVQPDFINATKSKTISIKSNKVFNILPTDRPGDSPTYNCLLFLPNNNILLVDSFYGFCCLVDSDKNVIGSCHLHFKPYTNEKLYGNLRFATFIGNDLFALSICDTEQNKIRVLTCDKDFKRNR